MKLKTLIGLLMFVVLASSAFAQSLPHPINGKVYLGDSKVDGVTVIFNNLQTGEVVETVTDGSGHYIIETANLKIAPYPRSVGHQFELRVLGCDSNERCYVKDTINFESGQRYDFRLTETDTVSYKGIIIGVAALLIIIFGGFAFYKRRDGISDAFVEEILQNAANVAIGKIRDLSDKMEVSDVNYALKYERATKNRVRVIDELIALRDTKQ